jgi:hypothetical protein
MADQLRWYRLGPPYREGSCYVVGEPDNLLGMVVPAGDGWYWIAEVLCGFEVDRSARGNASSREGAIALVEGALADRLAA